MEKRLELILGDWHQAFLFYLLFILLSAEIDSILKKRYCKQNLLWLGDSCNGKVVFTLLAKIIALHVGPTAIEIQVLALSLSSKNLPFDT